MSAHRAADEADGYPSQTIRLWHRCVGRRSLPVHSELRGAVVAASNWRRAGSRSGKAAMPFASRTMAAPAFGARLDHDDPGDVRNLPQRANVLGAPVSAPDDTYSHRTLLRSLSIRAAGRVCARQSVGRHQNGSTAGERCPLHSHGSLRLHTVEPARPLIAAVCIKRRLFSPISDDSTAIVSSGCLEFWFGANRRRVNRCRTLPVAHHSATL